MKKTRIIKKIEDLTEMRSGETLEIIDLDLGSRDFPRSVKLILRGSARLSTYEVTRLEAFDESFVDVANGNLVLRDRSSGMFRNEVCVRQLNESRGIYCGSSRAVLFHSSFGFFDGLSSAQLQDHSSGVFFGNSRAILERNSRAKFFDSSFGILYDSSRADFHDWSKGEVRSKYAQTQSSGESKINKMIPCSIKNLKDWLKWNNLKCFKENGEEFVFLYKWVDKEYKDFFSGTIDYSKDEVVAPDWSPTHPFECGRALHLATNPWAAFSFSKWQKGRMLKFKVSLKDLRVFTGEEHRYPYKARVRKLSKYVAELKLFRNEWVEVKE